MTTQEFTPGGYVVKPDRLTHLTAIRDARREMLVRRERIYEMARRLDAGFAGADEDVDFAMIAVQEANIALAEAEIALLDAAQS